MNIYIKMQESVLKRADPDFNPMLKAKLGRIGGDIWIAFDAFAYCIPQKTFLLSDVGFGEFTSEGTRKLFGDAHGGEGKIKLEPTGITRRIDGHNVVEFYDATGNICFDEKLLKKIPVGLRRSRPRTGPRRKAESRLSARPRDLLVLRGNHGNQAQER